MKSDTMDNSAIIEELKGRLTEKRFHHSLCVAKEAAVLAKRYGEDEEKAYRAGLLHDIMKDTPREEQLKIIEESGILLNTIELSESKLLHAIAGAAYIENKLNITDSEILSAVRYHTTAKAGMSLFEKILYLADFISEDRSYEGVEQLRIEVENDMEKGMLACTAFTVLELAEKNTPIHPDSVEAYNECAIKFKNRAK